MFDEEESEEGSLHFKAGMSDSGDSGMADLGARMGGSGTSTDCDFESLGFSVGVIAGIPCIFCEQHKVLGEMSWGR